MYIFHRFIAHINPGPSHQWSRGAIVFQLSGTQHTVTGHGSPIRRYLEEYE